jgi:predicted permease
VLTGLLFGLLPAWRNSHTNAMESLHTGARTTAGPQLRLLQHGLIVTQLAVVLVLLVSGGLLLESYRRLTSQELGYAPQSVTMLDLGTFGFESNEAMCRLYRSLHAQLAALPGVQAVGTVSSTPLTSKWTFHERAQLVGHPVPPADRPSLSATFVAFDYFQAMGIPLLEGRYFHASEMKDNGYGQLVMINQSAAALLFPNRSAIGGRFTVGSNPNRVLEIIGVVKDTRDVRLEEAPQPRFYWQYAFGGAQVVVRSTVPSRALQPVLLATVRQTDSRIIRQSVHTMTEIVSTTVAERRFFMTLLTAYGLLALGIATIGVFGVVAYQVAQRTNEFGVRLALGATPTGLARLVLIQSGRLALLGLVVGLALSFMTSRLLASQLFGLSPHEPILLLGVSMLLLFAALLASLLPAQRAARVEPMTALRCE